MTKAQLQEKVELLDQSLLTLNAELEAAKERNTQLNSELNDITTAVEQGQPKRKKVELPAPFEYRGSLYQFNRIAFILGGNKYRSEDVIANPDVLDALLSQDTNIIKKIENQ